MRRIKQPGTRSYVSTTDRSESQLELSFYSRKYWASSGLHLSDALPLAVAVGPSQTVTELNHSQFIEFKLNALLSKASPDELAACKEVMYQLRDYDHKDWVPVIMFTDEMMILLNTIDWESEPTSEAHPSMDIQEYLERETFLDFLFKL